MKTTAHPVLSKLAQLSSAIAKADNQKRNEAHIIKNLEDDLKTARDKMEKFQAEEAEAACRLQIFLESFPEAYCNFVECFEGETFNSRRVGMRSDEKVRILQTRIDDYVSSLSGCGSKQVYFLMRRESGAIVCNGIDLRYVSQYLRPVVDAPVKPWWQP